MSNLGGTGTDPRSALSLLVTAADSRDGSSRGLGRRVGGDLQDALRMHGLGGGGGGGDTGLSLEEQLLLQQQAQGSAFGSSAGSQVLLSQLRDRRILSQLGQQQQLAALLGLGGSNQATDVRSALAAVQMRQQASQQPQLTHADLLALTRGGALSGLGLSSILGQGGGVVGGIGGASGLTASAEHDSLQRLGHLEIEQQRRRLMTANAPLGAAAAAAALGGRSSTQDVPEPTSTQSMSRGDVAASSKAMGGAALRSSADAPSVTALSISSSSKIKTASSKPHKEQAAASPTDGNKDDLEKAPGSVIVPCRARGMPMDHNFKTAYFVIPENVKHGGELICSYFACRNAGIKFRYCSHCKVPVAKRNFRKRHKHGGEDVDKIAGDESGGEEEVCLPVGSNKGIPSHVVASNRSEASVDVDCISSQSADSATHQEKNVVVPEVGIPKSIVSSSMHTFQASKRSGDDEEGDAQEIAAATAEDGSVGEGDTEKDTSGSSRISDFRKKRWASLLARRPATKDGDSMSVWLMDVLAVSDLETPLKAEELSAPLEGGTGRGGKKEAAPPPQSDEEYDNDEASNKGSQKEPQKKVTSASPGNKIVKKKRSTDILKNDSQASGGSFAEWMERKKQKKQKLGSSSSQQTED